MKKKLTLLVLSLASVGVLMAGKCDSPPGSLTLEKGTRGVLYNGPYSPTGTRNVLVRSTSLEELEGEEVEGLSGTLNEIVVRIDKAGQVRSQDLSEYLHKCARVLGKGMYVYGDGADTLFYVAEFAEGDPSAGKKVFVHPRWIRADEVPPVPGE